MASATEIGGDVVAAGSAIAGLMLVYMGGLTAGYSSYAPQSKAAVRASFQRRMWLAFAGVILNVAALPFGLAAKALDDHQALTMGLVLLGLGAVWLIAVAVLTALEIK